jgi:hypothetical protein
MRAPKDFPPSQAVKSIRRIGLNPTFNQGYLTQVRNGSTVLHDWIATDAFGNSTEERFHGNAFRSFKAYDTGMGRLTSIQTGTTATPKAIQDLEFAWRSNSSLLRRIDRRNSAGTA